MTTATATEYLAVTCTGATPGSIGYEHPGSRLDERVTRALNRYAHDGWCLDRVEANHSGTRALLILTRDAR